MTMKERLTELREERRVSAEKARNVNRLRMWQAKRELIKHNRFDMVPLLFPEVRREPV